MTSSLAIGLISLGCILAGSLLGLTLPESHFNEKSKDTVKVGAGMIATIAALVLGLLVASAKANFDSTEDAITQRGAKVMLVDRLLADYGPETRPAREQLRKTVATMMHMIWPNEKSEITGESGLSAYERMKGMEVLQIMLFDLKPTTEAQRLLFSMAQQNILELRESRWLLIQQNQRVIPIQFLVVLLFWLTMLHLSFGLLAPRNATAITVLLITALSVSGAIFIIMDMSHPLQGVITVSSEPMRKALELLGQ